MKNTRASRHMFSNKQRKFEGNALLLAGLVGFIVGLSLLFLLRPYGSMGTAADGLDRHFIEQMIPHHEDAVSMSELAMTKAEHPELKMLAQAIMRDQTREIDKMREWYASWYETGVPEFAGDMMGGMGHGMMMGAMGDDTDLARLAAATQFDKEFIEQMIPHHQMAIMMAQMLLRGTDREELRALGEDIVRTQSDEITRMRQWYETWYGK